MSDLRIADAPELTAENIEDGLKIPTGGFGNYSITTGTIADWLVRYKDLALKSYVDSELKKKADKTFVEEGFGKLGTASHYDVEDLELIDSQVKTWSGRTQEQKNKENPSPFDFKAKGDGVSDDTQAFVDLEKIYQGQIIDLLGKTYRTTRAFTDNKYINGFFCINGAFYATNDDISQSIITSSELHFNVSSELAFGGIDNQIFPKSETVQQGVCIIKTPLGERVFISHNSIGDTNAANERARIVECEHRNDGGSASVIAFTDPLNIGHSQALGGYVDSTGQVWLYTTMKQTDGWSGDNARKGFARIRYKGAATTNEDITHYPMWGVNGSGHIFEQYRHATVGTTCDGKYVLMIGEDINSTYTMFVYDRAEVEASSDSLRINPVYMWVLPTPPSTNASPVGVTGDTRGIYVVYGTTATFGIHEFRAFNFTGTELRRAEFDDYRAVRGYDALMAGTSEGVPVVQELEGATIYKGELYTTMSDKWRTGMDIVSFRGKNFACIGGAEPGNTPYNRGYWVETSKAATKGEYDPTKTYVGGTTTAVHKYVFRLTAKKYSNSIKLSGAIPKNQTPRDGLGKTNPYLTYNYPATTGFRGWSEATREFLPTLTIRQGQFRFFDNTVDSTFQNYTSLETEDNGTRHYMTLRGYGGSNNTGYRVSIAADADSTFSGGLYEFTSKSSGVTQAVRSTSINGQTIFRNIEPTVVPLISNRRTGTGVIQKWMTEGNTKFSMYGSSSNSILVANNGNRLVFATDTIDSSVESSDGYVLQWTINPNGSFYPNRNNDQELGTNSLKVKKGWFNQLHANNLPTYIGSAIAKSSGLVNGDLYKRASGNLDIVTNNAAQWLALGDSITEADGNRPFSYPPIVANMLNLTLVDGAIAGTRVRSSFAKDTVTNPSIEASKVITIAYGTNDFKLETPIGTISSAPTSKSTFNDPNYRLQSDKTGTFYGDFKGVIEYIYSQNPQVQIMLVTPIRRTDMTTNGLGLKLDDYVNAIKAVAEYYGLPVLDNYNTSGFNSITIPTWCSDGLHPTAWAQENVLAPKIARFIQRALPV